MKINEITKEIHENAVTHGWWEEERTFGDIIALCHSELSEALEEYRNKRPQIYFPCLDGEMCVEDTNKNMTCESKITNCRSSKPEGIAIELADCIIRILDYCGHEGIDIEAAIKIKHEYNKTRPYKHGGKII